METDEIKKIISEHFSKMGKLGGQKTKETREPDYYIKMGKLGAQKRCKEKGLDPNQPSRPE